MNGKPLPKQGKKKPKSVSKLKKELDKLHSELIRRKYANQEGLVKCYTCPKVLHWKHIQCGHFISRSYLATRFVEENTMPQCVGCNIFGGGRSVAFADGLERDIGVGTVQALYSKARELTKWGTKDYEAKIAEVKEKLKALNN